MKKILILLFLGFLMTDMNSQLSKVPMGVGTKLNVAFPIINTAIDQINVNTSNILLKANISDPVFLIRLTTPALKVGGSLKVQIDSITSDGSNIRFYHGATNLTAIPGIGGAVWGTITGSLANQVDLSNALDLKADLISPTFTGVPVVPGYVNTSTTVNGHALTGNVTVSASDVGLGSVTNESKATMFTSPTFTGTPTVPGYVPTSRTVNGHALTGNISVTATDLSLQNVTNESKATMFTGPTFTGTVTFPSPFTLGSTSITTSAAQFNYLNTVTSNVQTQINALLDSIATLRALIHVSEVPHVSQIYYVSTDGDNGDDGKTPGTAWETLAYAEAHATNAGDTIALKKGDTWSVTDVLAITHGGANGYPIVWDGTLWGDGDPATIEVSNNRTDGDDAAVHFVTSGCAYVTFQHITVDCNNKNTFGVVIGYHSAISGYIQDNEHDITIDSCTILDVGNGSQYRIGFLCATWYNDIWNITIQNCTLDGADDEQLSFYGGRSDEWDAEPAECSNVYIGYNTLTNWGRRGEDTGYGLQINNKITDVVIEHNTLDQGGDGDGDGIHIESNEPTTGWFPTNVIVRYNKVTVDNSLDWCLIVQNGQAKTVDVYYNIFVQGNNLTDTNGGCAWVIVSASPAWTGAVLNFWNNVFYSTSGRTFQNDCAVVGVVRVRNNIFYNTGTNDTEQACMRVNTNGANTHSNNSYYRSANVDYTKVLDNGYKQTNAQVLAYEATSQPTDPKFTTPGTDFTLQAGSPCLNAGVNIPTIPQFDYDGAAVANPPEIGAYEK